MKNGGPDNDSASLTHKYLIALRWRRETAAPDWFVMNLSSRFTSIIKIPTKSGAFYVNTVARWKVSALNSLPQHFANF